MYRKPFPNRLLVLMLTLTMIPLLSFIDRRDEKGIIGHWELYKAMSAKKRSLRSDDITNRYKGNTYTFYEDGTVEFFRQSDSTMYKGTWEIGEGSYHKVNARNSFDRNEYGTLEMQLQSGDKHLKINGVFFSVGKTTFSYKELKSDLNYWYQYERKNEAAR